MRALNSISKDTKLQGCLTTVLSTSCLVYINIKTSLRAGFLQGGGNVTVRYMYTDPGHCQLRVFWKDSPAVPFAQRDFSGLRISRYCQVTITMSLTVTHDGKFGPHSHLYHYGDFCAAISGKTGTQNA